MRRTVFVSSTFQDLQTHRKAVWNVLGGFDVSIRGMEQFGARKESPLETCLLELEQSDVYVGIIAFRHGSIESASSMSYTQIEYERAIKLGRDVLLYLVDEENARFPIKYVDRGQARDKLEAFKTTLRERHTIETFIDEKDLATKLKRDLDRLLLPRHSITDTSDEHETARSTLAHFFLLPKSVAGVEIRLKLRAAGLAYPASRQVCKAFNFEFGATIGLPVVIVEPSTAAAKDVCDLFIDKKQVGELLQIDKGDTIDCYVRLHFSEIELDQLRARFRTRTDYTGSIYASNALNRAFGEPVTFQADAALAIELSILVRLERSPTNAA
jgi:Domain of unknown function (DUF4062)